MRRAEIENEEFEQALALHQCVLFIHHRFHFSEEECEWVGCYGVEPLFLRVISVQMKSKVEQLHLECDLLVGDVFDACVLALLDPFNELGDYFRGGDLCPKHV